MTMIPDDPHQWRVALIVGDLGIGGAPKQALYIAQALHEAGAALQVFYTSYESARFAPLEARGIVPVNFGGPRHVAGRVISLIRGLRHFKPHLVFSLRTYLNLYAGAAAPLAGSVCIGTLRSNLAYERAHFGRFTRLVCTLPKALVVNSFAARDQLTQAGWLHPTRLHVLPNVIDLGIFDQEAQAPVEPIGVQGKNIFFVGRLEPVKRLERLLAGFAAARNQDPELHLIIVGYGSERPRLETIAAEQGISEAVIFLGKRTDVPALLSQRAAALALVSEEEGFPNVILEAMAGCVPVITTPAGDAPVVIEPNRSGVVVSPSDPQALALSLLRFCGDPSLRSTFGAAGRARVEQVYSYAGLKDQTVAVIKAVFATKRGRG